MSWQELVLNTDYEIFTELPFPIRKKSNGHIVKEWIESDGYPRCKLNGKIRMKHCAIALQFIPNDDPDNKTEVDHINGIRSDYRIENLRWVNRVQNNRNRTSMKGFQYTYLDELPESAEPLSSYNGYDFDCLFIDYTVDKLYWYNGIRYRELTPLVREGNMYYRAYDIENKRITLAHKVLFG